MATFPNAAVQTNGKDQFSPRSSFLELVEYDSKAYTLDIHFKSGSQYRYLFDFPASYTTFKESPTHDAYFSKAIRGKYLSVPIKSHKIGRQEHTPLKAIQKRRTLKNGNQWIAGTVARAGL